MQPLDGHRGMHPEPGPDDEHERHIAPDIAGAGGHILGDPGEEADDGDERQKSQKAIQTADPAVIAEHQIDESADTASRGVRRGGLGQSGHSSGEQSRHRIIVRRRGILPRPGSVRTMHVAGIDAIIRRKRASRQHPHGSLLGRTTNDLTAWIPGFDSLRGRGGARARRAARAQAYPNNIVRIIVPFPPGGATDILGRVVAHDLQGLWGQTVVPEYKPGASGPARHPAGHHLAGRRLHADAGVHRRDPVGGGGQRRRAERTTGDATSSRRSRWWRRRPTSWWSIRRCR